MSLGLHIVAGRSLIALKFDVCVKSFHCKRKTKNSFGVLSLASSVLLPGWEGGIVVHSFSFYHVMGLDSTLYQLNFDLVVVLSIPRIIEE